MERISEQIKDGHQMVMAVLKCARNELRSKTLTSIMFETFAEDVINGLEEMIDMEREKLENSRPRTRQPKTKNNQK